MGTIPVSRGMPKSCIGTAARSAMISESTSSEGSSSPTWRLPMSRIPVMMSRYRMMVRIRPVNMSVTSLRSASALLVQSFPLLEKVSERSPVLRKKFYEKRFPHPLQSASISDTIS